MPRTLTVGAGGRTADVLGTVRVVGDASRLQLRVSDAADTSPRDLIVTESTIIGLTAVPMTFPPEGMYRLDLDLGTGNVTVSVQGTNANVTSVTSSGGNDRVVVGGGRPAGDSSLSFDHLKGSLSVNNPAHGTALIVDDRGDPTQRTMVILDSQVVVTGLVEVNFPADALRSLTIDAGLGGNTFEVGSNAWPTFIDSWGADVVGVGGSDSNLQNVQGDLHLTNPNRATFLRLDDSADPFGRSVWLGVDPKTSDGEIVDLTPGNLSWAAGSLVSIEINGGSGGNGFSVNALPEGTPVYIATGAGDDHVDVGADLDSLTLNGSLTINGQEGQANTLTLWDGATPAAGYELTGGLVARTGDWVSLVGYSNVASLTVQGSRAGSRYLVDGPTADVVWLTTPSAADEVDLRATDSPVYDDGKLLRAGRATHFALTVPANVKAGQTFSVTVTALDAMDNPATGTVHFGSSDGHAGLPRDFTFTAADEGRHTFNLTLESVGSQTVTVIDHATPGGPVTTATVKVQPAAKVRPLSATLVSHRVGHRKVLMVRVAFSDGTVREFTSPFQSPRYRGISATLSDINGDGVLETVALRAKKGRKWVTQTVSLN